MRKLVKNVLAMLIVGGTAVVMGNGTVSASNGIGINEQNFPDAQIRQIATQYDSNKDQILDTSEQKKLTELIVIETTENTGVQLVKVENLSQAIRLQVIFSSIPNR